MEAKELRIGNYVNKCHVDYGWSICEIEIDDLENLTNTDGIHSYEPIRLTEEWLKEFGLIKVKNVCEHSIWMFQDINFTYDTERGFIMLNENIITIVKFVNQLQNLYFFLTGEELVRK